MRKDKYMDIQRIDKYTDKLINYIENSHLTSPQPTAECDHYFPNYIYRKEIF